MEDIALSSRMKRISRPAYICALASRRLPRRWRKQGILRTVLLMWRLRLAYFLGADPARSRAPIRLCRPLIRSHRNSGEGADPGVVKTRLIPTIGAHAAAVLQERLTERTIATALAADIGPVTLWCSPDATHSTFLN